MVQQIQNITSVCNSETGIDHHSVRLLHSQWQAWDCPIMEKVVRKGDYWNNTNFKDCLLLTSYDMIVLPPLTQRSGLGPLKSWITMFMSVTMSSVGHNIQNVSIKIISFLSNSAMIADMQIPSIKVNYSVSPLSRSIIEVRNEQALQTSCELLILETL